MSEEKVSDHGLAELVRYIAEALVDDPKNVLVKCLESDTSVILELSVSKEDVGKVIGKGGQTAKALRKILSAAATKHKKKSLLQIIE
ncbi:MAG: KH domain-containing protein [Candidatus Sumerlaeia bacterium]|nr:KH domain-containing protein [Candidatus Sumerlaeia bacterium]